MSKRYFKAEAWSVTEDRYRPELNEFLETIFFLGNGYLGLRGTPEEGAGDAPSTSTNYVAPIYDLVDQPGGWPVTYVKHCSVNIPCPNWFGVDIELGGIPFRPPAGKVEDYRRTLDLRAGTLTRELTWKDHRGRRTALRFTRFVSLDDLHLAALAVEIRPLNWSGRLAVRTGIDGAVATHQDVTGFGPVGARGAWLGVRTKRTRFATTTAVHLNLRCSSAEVRPSSLLEQDGRSIHRHWSTRVRQGEICRLEKFVAVCTSRDAVTAPSSSRARQKVVRAARQGFDALLARHAGAWERIWRDGDVGIQGDRAAQQGIRFCVFNMHQNYSGTDPRVNMAAKGLSGPGYGGLYWWDTEIYMMPFFLYNAPAKARSLVQYRHLTLAGARHKAKLFGYDGAMYPWVTIDGEERSGDWMYGMLEQHVSSAVAHAVRTYVDGTGDEDFLWKHGAEMVIETSRFWASRANFHSARKRYVINFVTGPDEYTVGINNNCYVNYMAKANLEYGLEVVRRMKQLRPREWRALARQLRFRPEELQRWRDIARRLSIPFSKRLGVHEQDDSFLGREPFTWRNVPAAQKPVGRRWLWHKLMRSQAIKQADVLLLMFLHHDRFTRQQKRANYRYYEPRTTHESSLSPCVHAIIAAELGLERDAFRYYLRTARLDLDDVNGNANQGLHIACTAGAWASIVHGMAGMRQDRTGLRFDLHLPRRWKRLAFSIAYRGRRLHVELRRRATTFRLEGAALAIRVGIRAVRLKPDETRTVRV